MQIQIAENRRKREKRNDKKSQKRERIKMKVR